MLSCVEHEERFIILRSDELYNVIISVTQVQYNYTPGIDAGGYIVLTFLFVRSYVSSFLRYSRTFVELTGTNDHIPFIFGP